MRFRTHLMSGFFCFLLINNIFHLKNALISLLLFVIFSVLPDIDLHTSNVGKKIPVLSYFFEVILGHRGLTHSFWPIIALAFLLYPYGYAITLAAYAAHLLLDSITTKGIHWFWPFVKIRGSFETGKLFDNLLFYSLFIINIFLLFLTYA